MAFSFWKFKKTEFHEKLEQLDNKKLPVWVPLSLREVVF